MSQRPCVLLVHEGKTPGSDLVRYLEKQGYRVRLARTEEEALESLAGERPSLALFDGPERTYAGTLATALDESGVPSLSVGGAPADADERRSPGPLHIADLATLVTTSQGFEKWESKRALNALAPAILQALVTHSNIPLVVVDRHGHVLLQSDAPNRSGHAYFSEESSHTILSPEGRPLSPEQHPLSLALAGRATRNLRARLRDEDGNERLHVLHAAPVRDASGSIVAAFMACLDISDLEEARVEGALLAAQLHRSNRLEDLGKMAETLAQHIGQLAHAVLDHFEEDPSGPWKETAGQAARAADLSEFLLAHASRGPLQSTELDLSLLLRECEEALHTQVAATVQLSVVHDSTPALVLGDPAQIRRALFDLVESSSNALAPRGGRIIVKVDCKEVGPGGVLDEHMDAPLAPGNYACIEVHDDGDPIDVAARSRLFEPLFPTRFSEDPARTPGRRLGLASVLAIVREHQGAIRVESDGSGSRFQFLLPQSEPHAPRQPQRTSAARSSPEESQSVLAGSRALFVDDDKQVRSMASQMLEFLGLEVVTAAGGEEALRLFSSAAKPFDFVLLDLSMPDMHGSACLQELRRIAPDVPVLLCSGFNPTHDDEPIGERKRTRFLQKPFQLRDLERSLLSLLD